MENYTYLIYKDGATVYALNGSTGNIDYSGTFVSVMNQVLNSTAFSSMKILLKPDSYAIQIPNNPPHNAAIFINRSNVSIDGQGSVVYNDGTGTGVNGTYLKQGNVALDNIEITGITFDDTQGNNSAHQIMGFDYLVNNINIHDCIFKNLYNSALIVNTESTPYAQNIRFQNNWMNKNPASHIGGDFVEIMGKNIWVTDNYFEELTAPASAAFVPSFGKFMVISRNIIHKELASSGGGIDLTPLAIMQGETWAYSNVVISDNIIRYGEISVGGAGNGGSMGLKDILIHGNNVYRGIIGVGGGADNVKIADNIASGNSWIAADGQVWGANQSQKNIQLINNQISDSGNIGSILVLNQANSSNFIIKGNIISNEQTPNSMRITNGDNQLRDIIVVDNIATPGKPVLWGGTIAGTKIFTNNINC